MNMVKYTKNGYLKGRVPSRLVELVEKIYTKKSQIRIYKLYLVILNQWKKETNRRKKNKIDKVYYVPIAANYFRKVISTKYGDDLKFLKEHGFVGVETIERDPFELYQYRRSMANPKDCDKIVFKPPSDFLETGVQIESYSVGKHPKSYCILEEPMPTDKMIKIKMKFDPPPYREKNENFLRAIGLQPRVFQDNYSYRMYQNLSTTYKEELPYISDFIYYDVKSSIPHHIKKLLMDEGHTDAPFIKLFDGDFYTNFQKVMGFDNLSRDKIKKKFATLIYAKQHRKSKNEMARIRTELPIFYKKLKRNFGRDIGINETKFMLNMVVNDLPVDEVLTIHDGFIVFPEEESTVDGYLKSIEEKTKGFEFDKSYIKKVEFSTYNYMWDELERLRQFTPIRGQWLEKTDIETYLDDFPHKYMVTEILVQNRFKMG